MSEKWIVGYEGIYSASPEGKVFSYARGPKRALLVDISNRGYARVTLAVKHRPRKVSVHRIVATLYCHKKEGYEIVNHIDSDPLNNNFNNLEWVTQKENIRHSIDKGRWSNVGENHHNAKLKNSQAWLIRDLYVGGIMSVSDMAEAFSVSADAIYKLLSGDNWSFQTKAVLS